jgi:hypothetical protein
VPNVAGSTEVTLPANFMCGMAVGTAPTVVQTRAVTGGCEFTFDDDVQVLQASDYDAIPEFTGGSNLVKRVEVSVKKLDFVDGASNAKLDLATRIQSASFVVNGQQVLDKSKLGSLPITVQLGGSALDPLKAKVDARQAASVNIKAVAVLADDPPPPQRLKIDYDVQPAIVLGPGDIKLP